MQDYRRLGDWLLAQGDLNHNQLDHALRVKSQTNSRLGRVLVELGYVTEDRVAEALAEQYALPMAQLAVLADGFETERVLPFDFAIHYHVLITKIHAHSAEVVLADPLDIDLLDTLQRMLGLPIRASIAPQGKLDDLIRALFNRPVAAQPSPLPVAESIPINPPKKGKKKSRIDAQNDRQALLTTYLPDWEEAACA